MREPHALAAGGLRAGMAYAALVFFVFTKREREDALRASYHAEDTGAAEA